jgi:hypothetical protein
MSFITEKFLDLGQVQVTQDSTVFFLFAEAPQLLNFVVLSAETQIFYPYHLAFATKLDLCPPLSPSTST